MSGINIHVCLQSHAQLSSKIIWSKATLPRPVSFDTNTCNVDSLERPISKFHLQSKLRASTVTHTHKHEVQCSQTASSTQPSTTQNLNLDQSYTCDILDPNHKTPQDHHQRVPSGLLQQLHVSFPTFPHHQCKCTSLLEKDCKVGGSWTNALTRQASAESWSQVQLFSSYHGLHRRGTWTAASKVISLDGGRFHDEAWPFWTTPRKILTHSTIVHLEAGHCIALMHSFSQKWTATSYSAKGQAMGWRPQYHETCMESWLRW